MSEKTDNLQVPLTPAQKAAAEIDNGPEPKPLSEHVGWLSYLSEVQEKLGNLTEEELAILKDYFRKGIPVGDAIQKINKRRKPSPRKVPDSDPSPFK